MFAVLSTVAFSVSDAGTGARRSGPAQPTMTNNVAHAAARPESRHVKWILRRIPRAFPKFELQEVNQDALFVWLNASYNQSWKDSSCVLCGRPARRRQ